MTRCSRHPYTSEIRGQEFKLKYHTTTGLCCLFFLFQSPLLEEWSCCSPWSSTVRSPRQSRVLFLTPAHLKQLLDLQSESPPSLFCPQDQTDKEGCWKIFFCLDFSAAKYTKLSWDLNGILWIFHLTDVLYLQCLQFFLVSACNPLLLWSLSYNYRTLVCHKVMEKCIIWHAVSQISERLWKKSHGWLDQAHPLQGLCRPKKVHISFVKKENYHNVRTQSNKVFFEFFLPTFYIFLLKEDVCSMENCIKQNSAQQPYLKPTTC